MKELVGAAFRRLFGRPNSATSGISSGCSRATRSGAARQHLVSRDADPMLFALWFTALAMTPPMLVAVPKIIQYYFLTRPAEVVLLITTAERAFFVLYGMLATALLAALTWDALFPDRMDQEIVGALPVRPRTLASARLAAAITIGTVFAAAVSLPAAVIYSAASSSHPLIGSFPRCSRLT
jgi:hypothetical protein